MLNDTFEVLQNPRIKERIEGIKEMQDEATQLILIKKLFFEIQNASKSIVDEIGSGVAITNLDEVTTALHNETSKNARLLISALKDLQLSGEKQNKIISEVMKEAQGRLEEEFQTIRIKRPLDKVRVLNPEDFPKTDKVTVTNHPDLKPFFDSLEKKIEEAFDIPAAQVNVEAPIINIPQTTLNIPEIEFDPIIEELHNGLNKIRNNNKSNPLFIRLTDLQGLLDKLDEVTEASKNVMMGFPGIIGIRGIDGGLADPNAFGSGTSMISATLGDGSATVVTSGTRVQLSVSSVACKWVIVIGKVANAGTIYAGGVTIAVGRGRPLVPLQSERFTVSNLNQIYIDGDTNGDGVTYVYGT